MSRALLLVTALAAGCSWAPKPYARDPVLRNGHVQPWRPDTPPAVEPHPVPPPPPETAP